MDWIWKHTPKGVSSVLNAFSGSAVVAYLYKTKGLEVAANDRLRYCYHTARAIIENRNARLTATTTPSRCWSGSSIGNVDS